MTMNKRNTSPNKASFSADLNLPTRKAGDVSWVFQGLLSGCLSGFSPVSCRCGITHPVSIGDAMLIADFKEQEREKG